MKPGSNILLLLCLFVPLDLSSQVTDVLKDRKQVDSILELRGEAYLSVPVSGRKSFSGISRFVSLDKINDSRIYFYVNKKEFEQVIESGIDYQLLTPPSMFYPVEMAGSIEDVLTGKAYPTYEQYLEIMHNFSSDYSGLCTIDTIGTSIGNKLILAARIHRGISNEGTCPVVFYSSTMHGDEPLGYSLMIMLINQLLQNNEQYDFLDNLVILVNPLSNPDGTYFMSDTSLYGSKRYNLNDVDLNRNFPDITLGIDYSVARLEKENQYMVSYMEKYKPSISANFHTGAEVINYPWDSWLRDNHVHADNEWFIETSKDYVDTARIEDSSYLRLYPEGYVFGSDWYQVIGGRQDFVTYCLRGRELTIELSDIKQPSATLISSFWDKNNISLINLIEKARYGIHGFVYDSMTNQPLLARIFIENHDVDESYIYSNANTGKFFRYLSPGSYKVEVSSEGYLTKVLNTEVTGNIKTEIGIGLVPDETKSTGDPGIVLKPLHKVNGLRVELIYDHSESFSLMLYDLSGRIIREQYIIGKSGTIEGTDLQGIYILRLRSDEQSVSRLIFLPGNQW